MLDWWMGWSKCERGKSPATSEHTEQDLVVPVILSLDMHDHNEANIV